MLPRGALCSHGAEAEGTHLIMWGVRDQSLE